LVVGGFLIKVISPQAKAAFASAKVLNDLYIWVHLCLKVSFVFVIILELNAYYAPQYFLNG
jgi:hypothetical protein